MAIEEKNTVTTGVRSRENLNVDRVQTSPPASKNLSELEHDEANTGEFPQDASHRRAHIRRRLTHKFHHPAPLVEWTKFMHSETKNHMVAVLGEFIGTTMFLFLAFGGAQVANIDSITTGSTTKSNPGTLLYISFSFGFSLMVNAWVFFRISGGLFNPAVTLSLALLRALSPLRAALLFIAQLTGACFAAYLVSVMFPTPFSVQTTLGGGTSVAQGLFIEALCTTELVFTIIMLAKEKHRATFIAPLGIGFALFISELVAVYYTGGSLNPARSFGPAAVAHNFDTNHWIYWLGPFLGSLLATLFYWLFKVLEYEMANPGQDGDPENDPTQNPDHEIAQIVEERQIEVEELHAIRAKGGFQALAEATSQQPRGTAVDGGMAGDGIQPRRNGGRDLEAQ